MAKSDELAGDAIVDEARLCRLLAFLFFFLFLNGSE